MSRFRSLKVLVPSFPRHKSLLYHTPPQPPNPSPAFLHSLPSLTLATGGPLSQGTSAHSITLLPLCQIFLPSFPFPNTASNSTLIRLVHHGEITTQPPAHFAFRRHSSPPSQPAPSKLCCDSHPNIHRARRNRHPRPQDGPHVYHGRS